MNEKQINCQAYIDSELGILEEDASTHAIYFYLASATKRKSKMGMRLYGSGHLYFHSMRRRVLENDMPKEYPASPRWRLSAKVHPEAIEKIIELLQSQEFIKLTYKEENWIDGDRALQYRKACINGVSHEYIMPQKIRSEWPRVLIKLEDLIHHNYIPNGVPYDQNE